MSPKIWDLLDRLFQCRIQWICDRNEYAITGEKPG